MSQTIKLKRSSVAGKVPTTGNLDLGEIALNTNDGKVFFKKNDGTDSIQTILTTDAEITGNLYLSGSLTASSALIGPLTFPTVDGSENQFIKTDGNGNLSFIDGVSFPYTGSAIISSSLQVTGSSSVTGSFSLNDYSLPETDGGDGQVIMTNGEGTLVFNDVVKYVTVKNIETVTLPKGTPVHATSSVGNTVEVVAASASLARTMPATFVLNESLDPDQEGRAILTGFINGVNTSGFNEGDVVYVGESGGYTNVQPTGTNLIQNLGIVTVIDASNGAGYIYGSGRANATPNLLNGEVFFGEGNVSIQKPLSDILSGSSYVYSGSFSGSFEGDGSGLTGVGGIFTVSGSDVDNNQFSSEVSVLQFDSSTGLNVSQSAEGTAFVSIGSHYRDIVINGQTTLVATGSDQLELIAGDGIDLTTSTSDTNANSVSKEINFSVDSTVLRTTGDSVVSSSTQIDHDQTTNYSADEHFTQGSITTVGTVTSGDISGILPNGTISSSAQVNADSITNFDTNVKDKMNTDGVISSSIQIDHDQTTNFSSDEHFTQANITTVGTVTVGNVDAILPSGTVSSSAQLEGTFDSRYLNTTGDSVISSSEQVNADNITNFDTNVKDKLNTDGVISSSAQLDGTFLEITGDSVVSSSAQIDHDSTTNYSADEHFTQGDITTVGTVTVGSVTAILPAGTVSGSSQIDHDQTTNYSSDEHFTQANITTVGTVTSGDVSGILPSGVVSGSDQLTNTFLEITGDSVVSSSAQVSYTGLSNIPSGIVSGSSQVSYTGLSNIPSGIVSSSTQIDHDQTTNFSSDEHFTQANITTVGTVTSGDITGILPSGTVSASAQLTNTFLEITGDSVVSSSAQVSYTGLSNIPSGIVSSSAQVNADNVTNFDTNVKDKMNTDGVISSSAQLTGNFLEITGDSVVSSSAQIDHDQTTNYSSDEHFTQGDITTVGTVTSGDISGILPSGVVSGSTQLTNTFLEITGDSVISGSTEGDGQGQIKLNGVNVNTNGLGTDDSPQFTNLTLSGDLTVNGTTTTVNSTEVEIGDRIIVLNGQDAAGDSGINVYDTSTNQTGSLLWDSSGDYWKGGELGSEVKFLRQTGDGVVSSSAQIATEISGAFTESSESFSTRVTTNETDISNLQTDSGSFSTRVSTNETDISNLQTDSGSFSTRVSTNETDISNLQTDSGSFSTRITNNESSISTLEGKTLVSSSAQIDHDQTTNYSSDEHFTQANITTVGTVTSGDVSAILPSGVVSSSAQTVANLSNQDVDFGTGDVTATTGSFDIVGIGNTSPSQPLTVEGDISSSGNFTIRKDRPTIRLVDDNTSTDNFPRIILDTNNNQGVMLYHDEFDSFLPESGYGLVLGPSPNNTQFPSTGDLTFQVLGSIYADTETTGSGYKVLTTNDGLSKTGDSVVSSSAQISHDSTTGFVSNEHIDHSSVTLTAGDGLSGGGDITTNRSFAVDSTVVRTSGDQTIGGTKTFSSNIVGSGNLDVSGNVQFDEALLAFTENTDVDTGTEVISSLSTSTYEGGFFDVIIKNGTNVRASQVMIVHDGTSAVMSETSTTDLGDTSDLTLEADVSGGTFRLKATATSDNWSVRTVVRAF